ncbi:hypothetical protein TNCV_2275701 [Trichonephila clavipes]|nr:hypothetical protein TNCV_2275701 [Trichonephila clavipes]
MAEILDTEMERVNAMNGALVQTQRDLSNINSGLQRNMAMLKNRGVIESVPCRRFDEEFHTYYLQWHLKTSFSSYRNIPSIAEHLHHTEIRDIHPIIRITRKELRSAKDSNVQIERDFKKGILETGGVMGQCVQMWTRNYGTLDQTARVCFGVLCANRKKKEEVKRDFGPANKKERGACCEHTPGV